MHLPTIYPPIAYLAMLEIPGKALDFMGDASAAAALRDKRHAVADQFGTASDTLVLNLAEGASCGDESGGRVGFGGR